MFLASATSPPPKTGEAEDMDYIPGGADDLSYLLKKVTFRLHETYPNPSRGQSPAIPSLGSMNPADIV
jgi:YEATS domain-containing protein 4